MKHIAPVLLTLQLLSSAANARLNVVATTPDIASIARAIGDDKIELTTLAKPTEDPHFVDAKPSFIVKLNHADVLMEGGAGLEAGWLPALLDQSRNEKLASGAPGRIACSQGVRLLEVPASLDRAKGDIHSAGNPHYLADPVNAKVVAQHIAESLCLLDPKSAATFQGNLSQFNTEIDNKLAAWKKTLAPFQGRELAAYHNSWLYFGECFELKIDLFLEPKPGIPPTPAHLGQIIKKMKAMHVNTVIVDPYLNRKTAETVARNTGATVVDVTQFPGGVKGTEGGYIQMMNQTVNLLAESLIKKN